MKTQEVEITQMNAKYRKYLVIYPDGKEREFFYDHDSQLYSREGRSVIVGEERNSYKGYSQDLAIFGSTCSVLFIGYEGLREPFELKGLGDEIKQP